MMLLCLLQTPTKYTKQSVHTLIRNAMLSGRRLWIQNKPQTKYVTSKKIVLALIKSPDSIMTNLIFPKQMWYTYFGIIPRIT